MALIREVLAKNRLPCGLAGQLWGKLGFAATQMFGRYGRAKLLALNRRQHEAVQSNLNRQLVSALHWWLHTLPCAPARLTPTDLNSRGLVVSYSDGEGDKSEQFDKLIVCVGRKPVTENLLAADSGGHGGSDYRNIGCSRLLCWL